VNKTNAQHYKHNEAGDICTLLFYCIKTVQKPTRDTRIYKRNALRFAYVTKLCSYILLTKVANSWISDMFRSSEKVDWVVKVYAQGGPKNHIKHVRVSVAY